jgi:hypothetical protein
MAKKKDFGNILNSTNTHKTPKYNNQTHIQFTPPSSGSL